MDDLSPTGIVFMIIFAWILPAVLVFVLTYLVVKIVHKVTKNKPVWSKVKNLEIIIAALLTVLFFAAVEIQSLIVS